MTRSSSRPNLARRLARLFAQPRIPGVRRERGSTSILPSVDRRLRDRAAAEGKSVSRMTAEILSRACGYDAATGDKLRARVLHKVRGKE